MNRRALVFGTSIAVISTLPLPSYAQTATGQQQIPAPNQQPTQTRPGQGVMGEQGRMENFRAEYIQHYDALSTADKEKVQSIHDQIAALRKQEYQILGMAPPWGRPGQDSGTMQR